MLGRPIADDEQVDHIDGNTLNNRRDNLRVCTGRQNRFNQKRRSDNQTGFKGVSKTNSRYKAAIMVNQKSIYLGTFDTAPLAHEAYCEAALKYFGEFARFE
jgi:HNH endonuclease/AP2 domain